MTSAAQGMFKKHGAQFCAQYVERPGDGCTLYKCEHGHADCAHYHNGPCIDEMTKLISVKDHSRGQS